MRKIKIREFDYDNVYGSRRVIKDPNADQNHYYEHDIWTEHGKKLDGLIPQGYVVFGELIGWSSVDKPVQKGYTYKLPNGVAELYVYRVAHVNPQGFLVDLTWDQVVEFCAKRGLETVPELWRGKHKDFTADEWMDRTYVHQGFHNAVPLPAGVVDEGVCVRVDGLNPYILKAKSPAFLRHETKILDEGVVDLETAGSVA